MSTRFTHGTNSPLPFWRQQNPPSQGPSKTPVSSDLAEPPTRSDVVSRLRGRIDWHQLRESMGVQMRGPNELRATGIEWRVRPGPYADHCHVDIGIRCDAGHVVLNVPRRMFRTNDWHADTTKREVLEALLEQIQKQLAVEALEGR